MLAVFAIAIFLSAALLFQVQPFTGKILLPLVGGSPGVWNTCMVFFQGVLLLGYLYSHLVARYLKTPLQVVVHGAVLISAFWMLPTPIDIAPPSPEEPIRGLLIILAGTVGLPFFVVSTTGPLLQRWFSKTGHRHAHDPYFLYAASNAGSLIGLLAYPLVIEPRLTRGEQAELWMWGYAAFVAAAAGCAAVLLARAKSNPAAVPAPEPMRGGADAPRAAAGVPAASAGPNTAPVTWPRRLRWVALAFVPSSLMLGVTQIITTDVAPVPLIWIAPLLIYLLSFIVVFSPRIAISGAMYGWALAPAAIAGAALIAAFVNGPISLVVSVHLLAFATAAFMCHRLLAEDRPATEHLTEFYLWMSVGGVLGGVLNGLIAPITFNGLFEYPLVLGVALLLRPQVRSQWARPLPWVWAVVAGLIAAGAAQLLNNYQPTGNEIGNRRDWTVALVLIVAIAAWIYRGGLRLAVVIPVLTISGQLFSSGSIILHLERTFFGIHKVFASPAGNATVEDVRRDPTRAWHVLAHGTTNHGYQARREPEKRLAYSYYHPRGPMGYIMGAMAEKIPDRGLRTVVIGLGAGSLAAYSRPQDQLVFLEIDDAVIRIATNPDYFSFLTDARGAVQVLQGDGRLLTASIPDNSVDILIVDAFSSDSIPLHLVTLEAVRDVYLKALAPGGMLVFHVSNRHLDVSKPIAAIAGELGIVMLQMYDVATKQEQMAGKSSSDWVVLVRERQDAGILLQTPGWVRRARQPGDPLWTDDFSNILSVLKWTQEPRPIPSAPDR